MSNSPVLLLTSLLLLLLTLGDVVSVDNAAVGCCLPEKMFSKASINVMNGYEHTFGLAIMAYDYTQKKARVDHRTFQNGELHKSMSVIEDYSAGLRYIVIDGHRCMVSGLLGEMKDRCYLTKGRLLNKSYYGANSAVLSISEILVQKMNKGSTRLKAMVHVTVSDDGCIPVQEVSSFRRDFYKVKHFVSFFDSVTSVEDGVFDIPEECYANSRVARDLDSVNSLGSVDPDFKIPQDLQSVLDIIMA